MNRYHTAVQNWFRYIILAVIAFSVVMIALATADLVFKIGLGFSAVDLIMALIVLMGSIVVNKAGTYVFDKFG